MRMIRPELDAPQVTIAEEQEEYKPITAAIVQHPSYPAGATFEGAPMNAIVLAFRPTDEERRRIAAGKDVYVSLLTFGQPMQGIICSAGPDDMAAIYNVPVSV